MLRAATALVSAASLTMLSAPAGAWAKPGWGKPFRLTAPYATDLTAVNLAMNPRGDAAAVFSVQDQDRPATSDPFVAIRAVGGGVSPTFAVAGAQMVLDLAYDGSGLRLLTGISLCTSTPRVGL